MNETVNEFKTDSRLETVLEWYLEESEISLTERVAAETVLEHGITGDFQANAVIRASNRYQEQGDLSDSEATRAKELIREIRTQFDV